jgi:hypothetical protein
MKLRQDALAFAAALFGYGIFFAGIFQQALRGGLIAPSDTLDFGVSTYLSAPSLWSDGLYSGYPVAADPQTLTFYPLLQAFRIVGVPWNLFMVSAYVVAAAACFVLVRRLTGSMLAAAFGGLVFGFSGVMLAHIGNFNQIHAAAWLPLVLYGLHVVRAGRPREGAVITAAAYGVVWLAGHPQVAVYAFYLAAALVAGWLVIDRPDAATRRQRVVWSAVGIAGGICLAAVVILPMLELGAASRRGVGRWDLYIEDALPWRQALQLIFPLSFGGFLTPDGVRVPYVGDNSPIQTTSYLGLLPLALAFAATAKASSAWKDARLWLLLAAVEFCLALGPATPIGWLFYLVPGYASFQLPARHFFLVALCVAVAGGFGFAALQRNAAAYRAAGRGLAVVAVAGVVWGALVLAATPAVRELFAAGPAYLTWAMWLPLAVAAGIAALSVTGAFIAPRVRFAAAAIAVLLLVLHAVELAAVHYVLPGYHFVYAEVPEERVIPHPRMAALGAELRAGGGRILAADGSRNRFLLPNLPRAWQIPAASGTGSLGIERYLDALRMGGSGDVAPESFEPAAQGLDLAGVRYAMVPASSPLADYLRTQSPRWTFVEDLKYSESDPDTWYALFANGRTRPRAWCAAAALPAAAPQILDAVRSGAMPGGGAFDPSRVALVEEGDFDSALGAIRGVDEANEVTATVGTGGERRYLVTSRTPCLLVMSEVYYPWWRAAVDGAGTTLTRVNHTFMALVVPAGSHLVTLSLAPWSLWAGAAISAGTLLGALALLVSARRAARPGG